MALKNSGCAALSIRVSSIVFGPTGWPAIWTPYF
ncbi:hypothetical protein ABENE_21580 [Asticcacaulis benevestitus DSM 16100 = ATCC BAA-896]|uniref:Uncharacterized protein n=1 Tax=Asticcacaulis benevestitus DSM 16100 = ATCC BAA-896 TaxID=1121022 RepID=V4P3J8_9CAUL|nr:hypothetical protein ABENE_21580 [Asticcacaulis benevestitus DSM 16100 = ATCC BAA-896]